MAWFGKKRVTRAQAAAQFVEDMWDSVESSWPSLQDTLKPFLGEDSECLAEGGAMADVWLAVVATQMLAVPNLLDGEEAYELCTRIVAEALVFVADTQSKVDYVADTIKDYHTGWTEVIRHGQPPIYSAAWLLARRLGVTKSVSVAGERFMSPLVLDALAAAIAVTGAGWWKDFLAKHHVIA